MSSRAVRGPAELYQEQGTELFSLESPVRGDLLSYGPGALV